MADLRDFFQGASNSVASNVSAPVDGIAWLLRKAGLPIPQNPVGGSDWMAQRGLTAEPQNKIAGLLGESFGGVAPMLAAAKAPQIAKGLLQAGDNLAAPRTLNPQTGAIVWHGSPHKFDKFDSSKIGTGEGAQAYGHGLYLAESPDVAGQYAKQLTAPAVDGPQNHAAMIANSFKGDMGKALDFAKQAQAKASPDDAAHFAEVVQRLERQPQLYKVDLPDDAIAKMLDWDKPLSQQAPEVQKSIAELVVKRDAYLSSIGWKPGSAMSEPASKFYGALSEGTGRGVDLGGQAQATEALRKAGIPGIRYLDGGSRGAGQGSSNFVVFPGNEGLLSILERNGQALK